MGKVPLVRRQKQNVRALRIELGTKLRGKKVRSSGSSKAVKRRNPRSADVEADISPWTEALFAAEILFLHATPVYYGFGVPRGDDSGVVIIPGFLGTDLYLMELHAWLQRIGYRSYFSGVGINAECPNLLVQRHLNETIARARAETGRRIHLIGHSLGGVIARSIAGQRPRDIASVITLASPIRGTATSRTILHAADAIRQRILQEHGQGVLPDLLHRALYLQFRRLLETRYSGSDVRDCDLHS